MVLSVQQRYILEVLRRVGYIRRSQLLVLVRERFRRPDLEITQGRLDAMVHQLRRGMADVRIEGDVVYLHGKTPDSQGLEAIDVMLELTGGRPLNYGFMQYEKPELLRFLFGKGKLRSVSIASLSAMTPLTPMEQCGTVSDRTVWISESGQLPETVTLPPGHFFAARQVDGTHRFYGPKEPEDT